MPTQINELLTVSRARDIVSMRRELARSERVLRERAEDEAVLLAEAERVAWRLAQVDCFNFDQIRELVEPRLRAIMLGSPQKFGGERELGEMAVRDARRADACYTIISFACLSERMRFLRGGDGRNAVLRETLACGGVYTERGYFQEILR